MLYMKRIYLFIFSIAERVSVSSWVASDEVPSLSTASSWRDSSRWWRRRERRGRREGSGKPGGRWWALHRERGMHTYYCILVVCITYYACTVYYYVVLLFVISEFSEMLLTFSQPILSVSQSTAQYMHRLYIKTYSAAWVWAHCTYTAATCKKEKAKRFAVA